MTTAKNTKGQRLRSPAQQAATRKATATRTICMMQGHLRALEGYATPPMLARLQTVLQSMEAQIRATPAN